MFKKKHFLIKFISGLLILNLLVSCEKTAEDFRWDLREDFPRPQVPLNNPMSRAKVKLGKKLFYDPNLSFNQTQACATCHQQQFSFAEPKPVSIGSTGEMHRRNSPALVNIAYNKTLTWAHSEITSIEMQLLLPLFGEEPIELGITGNEEAVLARFNTPQYQSLFEAAFEDPNANFKHISFALAAFVRSLISFNSPFDQYAYDGDDTAISESAINGMKLFFSEELECHHCHGGFNFTQSTFHQQQVLDRRPFHNTGLYFLDSNQGYPQTDPGLAEITLDPKDNGKFRAPTLRNIALTAPYMHDGSINSLTEVIDFYASGGRNILTGELKGDGRVNPNKSQFIKGFSLTPKEKQDLIAFLETLTDTQFINDIRHAAPNQ
ncbi:MbnH family di-heme enzyme [Aliikangiella sp. IMCC44632]